MALVDEGGTSGDPPVWTIRAGDAINVFRITPYLYAPFAHARKDDPPP